MTLPIRAVRPDRNRPEPLWHQTELAVRALIADGTWVDGAQLPNEARLGEMLGVSRITMRHALRNLEEWGLLRREQGRGTFVQQLHRHRAAFEARRASPRKWRIEV